MKSGAKRVVAAKARTEDVGSPSVRRLRAKKRVLMLANARKFLSYVTKYAVEHNWQLTLVNDGQSPLGWKGDGALVSYSRSKAQREYVCRLSHGNLPIVGLSLTNESVKIPRVLADFAGSGKAAAGCLWSKGYRSFIFCTSERLPSGHLAYDAFCKSLRSLGHDGGVPWFVRSENVPKSRTYDAEIVSEAVKKRVLSLPKPCGVWCMSDSMALDVMDAALQHDISIPDSVGILGTNDNAMRCENAELPLSSIHSNTREMALKACELLDRAMSGEKLPVRNIFVPGLGITERESTGAYTGDATVRRAIDWMKAHLGETVGVNQLSLDMGLSESTLCRLFREKLHTTPAAELRVLRLKRAKSLLRTTDFSLQYIAKATGFANAPHLVNIFREAEGETPTVWRRKWE